MWPCKCRADDWCTLFTIHRDCHHSANERLTEANCVCLCVCVCVNKGLTIGFGLDLCRNQHTQHTHFLKINVSITISSIRIDTLLCGSNWGCVSKHTNTQHSTTQWARGAHSSVISGVNNFDDPEQRQSTRMCYIFIFLFSLSLSPTHCGISVIRLF